MPEVPEVVVRHRQGFSPPRPYQLNLVSFLPAYHRIKSSVRTFQAVEHPGLALFAVAGTQKALGYGLNPVMSALLGTLTGIGGGMLRDVLLGQIPTVLRSELYAVAALAGASVVVVGYVLNFHPAAMAIAGAVLCFGIRLIAIRHGWRLPVALDLSKFTLGGILREYITIESIRCSAAKRGISVAVSPSTTMASQLIIFAPSLLSCAT